MKNWMKKNELTCGNFAAEMYHDTTPDASYMELWLPLSSSQKILKIKETWDKTNGIQKPSMETIGGYVNSPLFECLCKHVELEYQSKPVLEF